MTTLRFAGGVLTLADAGERRPVRECGAMSRCGLQLAGGRCQSALADGAPAARLSRVAGRSDRHGAFQCGQSLDADRPTGPAPRSPRCSTCRSLDLLFRAAAGPPRAPRAERGAALAPCCRSRPAAARRIAAIAASRRTPRPGSRPSKLMDVRRGARRRGARPRRRARGRFCMGAAWREPKDRDMRRARARWSRACKAMGLETCMTLGMLTPRPGRPARRGGARLLQPQSSTPRPNITARSSPPAPSRTGSTRSSMSARRAWRSAAAASSAWARRRDDRVGFIHALATLPAPSRKRADQRAGADQGHGARRHAGRHAAGEDRRHRVRPHRRGRADHRCRARWSACPPAARA